MSSLGNIAEIAVAAPLPKTLSYSVPESLQGSLCIGSRVKIPLGRRTVVGFVLDRSDGDKNGLKPIREILDDDPLFPATLVPLFRRVADYYCHPLGQVIATALPAGLAGRGEPPPILWETFVRPGENREQPRGQQQRNILALVRKHEEVTLSELRQQFSHVHAPLKRLVELGMLQTRKAEKIRDPFLDWPTRGDTPPSLTQDQQQTMEQLAPLLTDGGFHACLLHGVTGSGKTEIYLQSIAQIIADDRQALVLVPEIALTPQLVSRFRARFAPKPEELKENTVRIAVLHSGLSDGERFDTWRRIARQEVDIVIGARSAVFAPLSRLGIIIVDEEHEASYKQGEGLRYHARDTALLRGQMEQSVVLCGSATPALTSWQLAAGGKARLFELPNRVAGRPLPEVELLDMKQEPFGTQLSQPLSLALEQTLEKGEQALLLLNRRGFAPFMLCADCGKTFRCPNCDITLTFHRQERKLRCHYCDFIMKPPDTCPGCSGCNLEPEGIGTERLEMELQELLPDARIARMDRDTMAAKGAHRKLLEQVGRREIDILIGTQMVAKGHDFPDVTLVGVLNADASLNFPDFRAGERTFALLAQVAGRAGRGERAGKVIIQTYEPDHYALDCAARHDYQGFVTQELTLRQALGYPPFGYLVNLVLSGNQADRTRDAATNLAQRLLEGTKVELLGPAPCILARLRGKSRYQILLKATTRQPLRQALHHLENMRQPVPSGVSLHVDVDPVDMF